MLGLFPRLVKTLNTPRNAASMFAAQAASLGMCEYITNQFNTHCCVFSHFSLQAPRWQNTQEEAFRPNLCL